MGTPCSSFSIARSGRPPPLRDAQHPKDLLNLSDAEQRLVYIGNTLAQFSASILNLSRRLGLPCTLENQQTSRIWLYLSILQIRNLGDVSDVVVHFCEFGAPGRKATRVLGCNINLGPLERCICQRPCRGTRARSGSPHVQLRGTDSTGGWKTRGAQTYPRRFCTALARCLYNHVCFRTADHMPQKLQ